MPLLKYVYGVKGILHSYIYTKYIQHIQHIYTNIPLNIANIPESMQKGRSKMSWKRKNEERREEMKGRAVEALPLMKRREEQEVNQSNSRNTHNDL